MVNRRRTSRAVALRAIGMGKKQIHETPRTPGTPGTPRTPGTPGTPRTPGTPSHPNINFGKRVMSGVQAMENKFQKNQKQMENEKRTAHVWRPYVTELKVKVLVARVKRRVSALFNHYGIKNASNMRILMPKVSKFVIKDVGNMRNVNNVNNEAGVRRLIYKINRAVPDRFLTTKQSRFKKLFRPNNNTNRKRTPW